MSRLACIALIAALGLSAPALAAQAPLPSPVDPRAQVVEYQPDQVVLIRGVIGYQLMIEFDRGERIESVSIGDSLGWQVTPNRRANTLFLKPIDGAATNLTVLTDVRRYLFELTVARKGARNPPYAVRFLYPERAQAVIAPPPEAPAGPQVANAAYAITGAQEARPLRVFDDGKMTYFEWPQESALPAIFAVSGDGAESIVNYAVRGPHVVVEQVAAKFMLRNGKQVASVVNEAFPLAIAERKSGR